MMGPTTLLSRRVRATVLACLIAFALLAWVVPVHAAKLPRQTTSLSAMKLPDPESPQPSIVNAAAPFGIGNAVATVESAAKPVAPVAPAPVARPPANVKPVAEFFTVNVNPGRGNGNNKVPANSRANNFTVGWYAA